MTREEAFHSAQRAARVRNTRYYAVRYGSHWAVTPEPPPWHHDGLIGFDPEPEPPPAKAHSPNRQKGTRRTPFFWRR